MAGGGIDWQSVIKPLAGSLSGTLTKTLNLAKAIIKG